MTELRELEDRKHKTTIQAVLLPRVKPREASVASEAFRSCKDGLLSLLLFFFKIREPIDYFMVIRMIQDFPGSPVAETPHSQCRGSGFNPDQGRTRSYMPQLTSPHVKTRAWYSQINKYIHFFFNDPIERRKLRLKEREGTFAGTMSLSR